MNRNTSGFAINKSKSENTSSVDTSKLNRINNTKITDKSVSEVINSKATNSKTKSVTAPKPHSIWPIKRNDVNNLINLAQQLDKTEES